MKVDYFPPLMPVMDVAGSATYDHSSFHITSTGGKIQDMKMTKGKVVIVDLDKISRGGVSKIDIDATVTGPMKTALKLLDSKPLEYPAMLGLKSEGVGGTAETQVNIKFPIRKALVLKDIKIKADATVAGRAAERRRRRHGPDGRADGAEVDNRRIKVEGKGKLGTMPADFDWVKNFSKDADGRQQAHRVAAARRRVGGEIRPAGNVRGEGHHAATVEYTLKQDKSACCWR